MSGGPATGRSERLTLAEVVRAALPVYIQHHRLQPHHWKVLRAIMACRTPQLGGHLYQCGHCGKEHFVPHSCRNRHCPSCQGINSTDWLARQAEVLLPIPYFHLVFTLPHDLNPLIQQNQAKLYDLLFATASATPLEFGRNNLQAQIGVTAVLHTWSQTLLDHYHLHCIVTGGGLRLDGLGWKSAPAHWLFPVRALSVVFRAKFRDGLRALFDAGQLEFHGQLQPLSQHYQFDRLLRAVTRPKWVVYAKRPFPGAKAVLAYLSRYTHRVGITNHRIRALDSQHQTVTFDYKDYADASHHKLMTLGWDEFLRRFRLHLLPARFVKNPPLRPARKSSPPCQDRPSSRGAANPDRCLPFFSPGRRRHGHSCASQSELPLLSSTRSPTAPRHPSLAHPRPAHPDRHLMTPPVLHPPLTVPTLAFVVLLSG